MDLDDYLSSDATTLAGLVAAEEVTAAELLAVARERADAGQGHHDRVDDRVDRVADARAADPSLTGAFAGVPFLIKDLAQEYAGFPTSGGSRALAHDVATEHALVTRRFLEAGLVIFGKTNTPEFGAVGADATARLQAHQTGELMFGMVTQGVVSRTVRDSAALFDAIIAPS